MKKEDIKVKVKNVKQAARLHGMLEIFGEPISEPYFTFYSENEMYLIFGGIDWLLINKDHPRKNEFTTIAPVELINLLSNREPIKESLLSGRCAIQVNNEREFKLLMAHYESKGWTSYRGITVLFYNKTHENSVDYHDQYRNAPDSTQIRLGYTLVPFSDFASEVGIKVPEFIMTSEDGVPLYEGDEPCWVFNENDIYRIALPKSILAKENSIMCPSYVMFSTKEAAEAWISEQNRPRSITIELFDSKTAILSTEGIQVTEISSSTKSIWLTPSDLEDLNYHFQTLQPKGSGQGLQD